MAQAIKWQIPFATNDPTNPTQYRIDIYAEDYTGQPIQLLGGPQPFATEENKNEDFFTPVRTQTGNIQVCTKLPSGGLLDIEDMLPTTNTSNPVQVMQYISSQWTAVWYGYLSCDMYNQPYTEVPENITLPVVSILEAWKSVYISTNKIETVAELLSELLSTPGHFFQNVVVPQDYEIFNKTINTSIFVEKKEYQNEESVLYRLEGKSAYHILSALCTFMGWVAREDKGILYMEVAQGYGLIEGTVTRNMADLVWRGNNQQRSIRQGRRMGSVVANLGTFSIKTGLGGIPFGSFDYEKYQQIGSFSISYKPWVYFLPSSYTTAYSNMTLLFYTGSMKMGIANDPSNLYDFSRMGNSNVSEMILNSIPYANNYPAYVSPTIYKTIFAGACFARMQVDAPSEPDYVHQNTKDGLFVSLFPGAWKSNTSYTQPIFEMLSVQNFACIEDGYINISSLLTPYLAAPSVGVSQAPDQLWLNLQIGDRVWNGSTWVSTSAAGFLVQLSQDGTKFNGNWSQSMDIDETDGLLIPTFYTENGVKKHVFGRVSLRIHPETYIPNIATVDRQSFICNIFFEQLSIDYIMKRSVQLSDRSENTFLRTISTDFSEDVEVSTELASWYHNNPSPSLLYNDDQTPMQYLPYLTQDGETTENQRPEINLLNRMTEYYQQPRTILKLEVKHINDVPLPLLRLNGIGDGKVYLPLAESRDWKAEQSTLTCFETPN